MEKLELAISLNHGQTLYAQLRPEDERQLAELLGDRGAIDLAAHGDDVEGHTISGDVLVDVEGHAFVVRLPQASDVTTLRRALAVGAVTATIVGAGVIAGLHPQVPTSTSVEQAPPRVQVQAVPGPALRAQRDEMQREQAQENVVREQTLMTVPLDAANPAIPAQALRAERNEMQREGEQGNVAQQQTLQTVPLDANNPAIPPQAQRAGTN